MPVAGNYFFGKDKMGDINTLRKTKEILNRYNIKANKRFGQNFLIDDNILSKIIDVADIKENELVIEIGPGLGNLSEYILLNSTYALLIEIDNNMITVLGDRLNRYNNYKLVNEDILKIDIDSYIEEIENNRNISFTNVKVIANLPYYITTPILFKLLQNSKRINEIIVMVQKEVAQRMVAKPKTKDYGILTLMVEYLTNSEIKIDVPRSCFIPAPNVDSAVIKLVKNDKYKIENEDVLFKLIHKAFAQRRKKMVNSLVSNKFMDLSKEDIESILNKCGISINARAEELSLNDYLSITKEIKKEK